VLCLCQYRAPQHALQPGWPAALLQLLPQALLLGRWWRGVGVARGRVCVIDRRLGGVLACRGGVGNSEVGVSKLNGGGGGAWGRRAGGMAGTARHPCNPDSLPDTHPVEGNRRVGRRKPAGEPGCSSFAFRL
jgi:hypothetical protein